MHQNHKQRFLSQKIVRETLVRDREPAIEKAEGSSSRSCGRYHSAPNGNFDAQEVKNLIVSVQALKMYTISRPPPSPRAS